MVAGILRGCRRGQRARRDARRRAWALLYEACFPITGEYAFGPWPDDLPVQIHGKADDEFFAHEGDVDAARELVAMIGPDQAELFVYPGDEHLFVDSSLPTYDADAAALVTQRTLHFLSGACARHSPEGALRNAQIARRRGRPHPREGCQSGRPYVSRGPARARAHRPGFLTIPLNEALSRPGCSRRRLRDLVATGWQALGQPLACRR